MRKDQILEIIEKYPKFYKLVWLECLKIPKGEIRTYKWIAERIGKPKSYRLVGKALSKNPLPGIIPCHRVIRSDGNLGGYKLGTQEKRRLLSEEGCSII